MRAEVDSRDRTKFCDNHREHGHTTNHYWHLTYLLEMLVKRGHLEQYVLRTESSTNSKETELAMILIEMKLIIVPILATSSRPLSSPNKKPMPKTVGAGIQYSFTVNSTTY